MAEKQKILIVDDDESIAGLVSLYLKKECYDTMAVNDGLEAVQAVKQYQPDLILLDIMLPGMDGYEVLRNVRSFTKVPVIMMSAKGETFDKVLGLELGADDYIIKPFDNKEMVARVKAVLRRYNEVPEAKNISSPDSPDDEIVRLPDLTISLKDYNVFYKGEKIEMPPRELELFYFLASHPNQVFTREQLLDHIWSYDYMGDTRTVDVHIKRLREKFAGDHEWSISTVWGIGYKFEPKKKE
ncbi:MAG: response regulator transcription factor [Lachnospiraceae bacterium]|jgi:DNA-binding response OmpR family regulator|nr:response regulator transcription factor [Lachnospiraceae bacterium]MEE3460834.1 response regulator transcription factor [Lachnospiraceae bacterium]